MGRHGCGCRKMVLIGRDADPTRSRTGGRVPRHAYRGCEITRDHNHRDYQNIRRALIDWKQIAPGIRRVQFHNLAIHQESDRIWPGRDRDRGEECRGTRSRSRRSYSLPAGLLRDIDDLDQIMSNGHWSTTTLEEHTYLSNLAVLPDGRFVASGWGPDGASAWMSTDGLSWDTSSESQMQQPLAVGPHGAITYTDSHRFPQLNLSADLVNWESLGLEEILPDSIDWWFNPVVLNGNGIALFAHGSPSAHVLDQPQTTSITRNGYELAFRPDQENLILSDGTEMWTVPTYSATISELIEVDVVGRTLTFLRPGTNEPVATFRFAEITSLATDAWSGFPTGSFIAFLHTKDRVNWLVRDLPLIPDNLQIIDMVITEDQVILAAIDTFSFRALNITPSARILVGDLP